jgi:hypothetical protein
VVSKAAAEPPTEAWKQLSDHARFYKLPETHVAVASPDGMTIKPGDYILFDPTSLCGPTPVRASQATGCPRGGGSLGARIDRFRLKRSKTLRAPAFAGWA